MEEPFEQSAGGWGVSEAHPIDPRIREEVLQKLRSVELECGVRVLFACESGSRGWGFASPDSDYDVRFAKQEWLPARPVLNAFLARLMQRLETANPQIGQPDLGLLDEFQGLTPSLRGR